MLQAKSFIKYSLCFLCMLTLCFVRSAGTNSVIEMTGKNALKTTKTGWQKSFSIHISKDKRAGARRNNIRLRIGHSSIPRRVLKMQAPGFTAIEYRGMPLLCAAVLQQALSVAYERHAPEPFLPVDLPPPKSSSSC